MLDPKEIDLEIARLEYGESSYPAYAKLANLYTIRNQMRKQEEPEPVYARTYSVEPATAEFTATTELYGDSDFLRALEGKDPAAAWSVMDELMDTLHTVNPKVYAGVLRKIRSL